MQKCLLLLQSFTALDTQISSLDLLTSESTPGALSLSVAIIHLPIPFGQGVKTSHHLLDPSFFPELGSTKSHWKTPSRPIIEFYYTIFPHMAS